MTEQPRITTKDLETAAVLIARFCVPKLHPGHEHLVDFATPRHGITAIVLGIPRTRANDRYSLSFEDRRKMVLEKYPNVVVLGQRDCRTVEQWSSELDALLEKHFKGMPCVLYGSRDSFIPKYTTGKHRTHLVEAIAAPSGTDIREALTVDSFTTEAERIAFRAGQIRAELDRPGVIYPTADVILFDETEEHVWLGRKEGESAWRFCGGFGETADDSMLEVIVRELSEEMGVTAERWKIIGTKKVDDWRYRGTKDCIMTTLYTARLTAGQVPQGNDDLPYVQKVPKADARHWLTPEHRPLWDMYLQSLSSN